MGAQSRVITTPVVVRLFLIVVLFPFLPLLISRNWGWWEAWVYALSGILNFAISRVLAARRHPDIIAERARTTQHENAQPWDKRLAPYLGLGWIAIILVIGLDELLGWSPAFPLPLKILALALILAGYALGDWALVENRFFSGMVRLQTERGHHVVSSGPYRWMRHPGYAGALLSYLATPIFLDSSWAYLPTAFTLILLVVRTAWEDRFLQAELPGYREYARRVRYRLVPGVW